MTAILFFLFLPFKLFAPLQETAYIPLRGEIKPFKPLIDAIVYVESGGDVLALNRLEMAVGAFQIRQVRIDHYNRLTGKNYILEDMYDYDISEEIFLYFACRLMDFETIAKKWNGSGPMTDDYWQRVKACL